MGVGQDAEAGIVGQQMTAAGELCFRPADPGITRAQVLAGAPAQQRQPFALILDDIAEMLPTSVAFFR